MLPAMSPNSGTPAPVTLVIGPEELLAERAVAEVVTAARALDGDVDVRELDVAELAPGAFAELVSPSLFGERRVLVVRGLDRTGGSDDDGDGVDAGEGALGALTAYV